MDLGKNNFGNSKVAIRLRVMFAKKNSEVIFPQILLRAFHLDKEIY